MKKIDWSKWSAIAEIVSSIAILVTLAYLAVQTAQNTAAIQGSTRQAMLAEDRELITLEIQYPEIQELEQRSPSTMSDTERTRLTSWLRIFGRNRENQYLQYKNGVIDEATWLSYANATADVLSLEGTRPWWEKDSYEFDPDFAAYVNELLANRPVQHATNSSD